jgi:two-component system chemotaxis response regulator CheY
MQTILIVEDDLDVRESLAEVVEKAGYHVDVASNGLEALAYLHDHRERPCVVLLDLMMPVMDGWTFMQVARQEGFDVPVVVFSAAAAERLPQHVPTLRKPVERDALLRVLSTYA